MSKRRSLRVGANAARQISEIDEWWRVNRTASSRLFVEELSQAYELVRYQPDIGRPVIGAKSNRVRRIRLRRSRYHVYYQESDDGEAIEVLAVWHTNRGSGPDLR